MLPYLFGSCDDEDEPNHWSFDRMLYVPCHVQEGSLENKVPQAFLSNPLWTTSLLICVGERGCFKREISKNQAPDLKLSYSEALNPAQVKACM
jgi:hypothetical protein